VAGRPALPKVLLILSLSPKQRFLKSPFAKVHAELAVSESFIVALEYALLEMVNQLPMVTDPSKQWDCHSQLIGARRYIDTLKGLATPHPEPAKPPEQTLNYANKR
jgi:hypothetical protein